MPPSAAPPLPGPRSRYTRVLGRRYILIRPRTLWPAVAVDVAGALAARLLRRVRRRRGGDGAEAAPRRILAIRLDHIGDVLLTTPALRLLRARLPEARLDVLAGPWAAELLRGDPDVDRVLAFDAAWYGGRAGARELVRLVRALRRERYDLVLDFRGDLRHLLLARAAGARLVYGYGIRGGGFLLSREVPYDESAHEVDRAVGLVRALDAREPAGAPAAADAGPLQIAVRPEERAEAARLLAEAGVRTDRLLVALCPASRNPTRFWPGDGFARVAAWLHERHGAQVLVFADRGSADAALPILEARVAGVRSLVGRTSLGVFAAALERVDLIVSVESSPIHFASALGKPIVTLFGGSSLPQHWGPYRTRHRIVHRPVPCSPCHLLRCPLERVLCMEAITPEDVVAACSDLLEELASGDAAVAAKLAAAARAT